MKTLNKAKCNIKKTLSMFLVFCMVFTMVPTVAFAGDASSVNYENEATQVDLTFTEQPALSGNELFVEAEINIFANGFIKAGADLATPIDIKWYISNTSGQKGTQVYADTNHKITSIEGADSNNQRKDFDMPVSILSMYSDGTYYLTCEVKYKNGEATSDTLEYIKTPDTSETITITKQPYLWANKEGVSIEAKTTSTPQQLKYQWYYNNTDSNTGGTTIGANEESKFDLYANTITTTLSDGTYYLYCVVTDPNNSTTKTSNTLGITLSSGDLSEASGTPTSTAETPKFEYAPGAITANAGEQSTSKFYGNAKVSDGGTISYEWYSTDTDGATTGGTPISGATSEQYKPGAKSIAGTYYYYVVATNTKGGVTASATHSGFELTVNGSVTTPVIVSSVSATLSTPIVGETIGDITVVSGEPSKYDVHIVSFSKGAGKPALSNETLIEADISYLYALGFTAKEGYEFAGINYTTMTATVNGEYAQVNDINNSVWEYIDSENSSVTPATVTSIEIKTPSSHKTAYKVGETLDVTDLVITATKSNSSRKDVNVTSDMVTGFDSSAVATSKTLTITYEGKTTTYDISVAKADVATPSKPILDSKTHNSITVTTVAGQEYSLDGGAWQDSGVFSGLTAETAYEITTRVKDTATTNVSAVSPALSVTTSAAPIDALTGTATITGTAKYDETLTANLTGGNSTNLTYVWKANGTAISGATNSTYKLTADEIGDTITVEISASDKTGTVTSSATSAVAKANAPTTPAAPTLDSKTHNSITVTTVAGQEYRIGTGAWQTSGVFSGLTAETAYSITTYIPETATTKASAVSSALSVTTDATPVITRTITASAGANGAISPSGSVTVADGGNKTFTFTPDAGYEIGNLTVNGVTEIPTGNSYTITNVTADMAINIDFVKTYVPTLPTVTGNNQTMTVGTANDVTFKIDANFDDFNRVEYKGSTLDAANYTAASGSIVITLKGSYVKTLAVGTHTFTAIVGNFNVPMNLIVKDVKEPEVTPKPDVKPTPVTPPAPTVTTLYNLVVNYGSGDGQYEAGTWVTIEAEARKGLTFSHWTSNEVTFDNKDASKTWFIMNSKDVTVTAVYVDAHGNPQTGVSESSPKTGDNSPIALCLMALALSLGGIGFTVYKRKETEE